MPETDGKLPIGPDLDLLLDAARAVITGRVRVISAGNIQRRIRVGYVKADRLLLLLEQEDIITRCDEPRWQWECLVPRDGLDATLERIRKSAGAREGGS